LQFAIEGFVLFPGGFLLNRTFSMKSFVDAAGGLLEMSNKF
jgi:hypothetical protein